MKSNFYGKWSKPKLVEYKGNLKEKWFIKYTWYPNDGPPKSIQSRGEINKQTSVSGRRRVAAALIVDTEEQLLKDFNPDTKQYNLSAATPEEQWQIKPIDQALNDALLIKKSMVSRATFDHYRQSVAMFIEGYKSIGLTLLVKEVRRSTITNILSEYAANNKISNKAYNRRLSYVSPIFSEIMEKADLPYSPASKVKKRPVTESEGFVPPTKAEMKLIKAAFKESLYPEAIDPIEVVYHTRIRPKEVLLLKIEDIKILEEVPYFKIVPDLKEENSKTKKIRLVPINKHLWNKLAKMNLHLYPSHWYLFGKRGMKFYVPAPNKIRRKHLTDQWRKVVKQGLGFNCDMYGVKVKGIDDSIEMGVSLRALQYGSGHTKESMTAIYGKRSLTKLATDELINNAPEF